MKKLCLAFAILILTSICIAQISGWQWAQNAGGMSNRITTNSEGYSFVTGSFSGLTSFGNYFLTPAGDLDVFVAKMDNGCNWLWARQAGGINSDEGRSISADNNGNCFVVGSFSNTATFGTITLTGEGIFVAKLDTNGNWLWATGCGGSGYVSGKGVSHDNAGNCYLTGSFYGPAVFGATTLTGGGAFIAKLDTNGNWIWAKKTVCSNGNDTSGLAITTSSDGTSCITGRFIYGTTFGNTTLISNGSDYYDVFVAKLDNAGNWLWAVKGGGTSEDWGQGIAADNSGNICITGHISGSADFGATSLTSSGAEDIFIAKADTNGNLLWAKRAGGEYYDGGTGISVDYEGNIYATGTFAGTAAFGTIPQTSIGGPDIFVAKLDSDGNWIWVVRAGGVLYDLVFDIALDNDANCYLSGNFGWEPMPANKSYKDEPGAITRDATFGSITLPGAGGFFAKLGIDVGNDDDTTPEMTAMSVLYDAYPNPFPCGNTTNIKTYIAELENGTLSIYNLWGQCISSYMLNPGTHTISFDGKGLASGVYFYQLKTKSVNTTKKLVFLR